MNEMDDDKPRRSTRGSNPLPPQKGPLFPPLPPKTTKNSPKTSRPRSSSRSNGRGSRISSTRSPAIVGEQPSEQAEEVIAPVSPLSSKHGRVGTSATSLTPPPLTSDDPAQLEEGVEAGEDEDEAEAQNDADEIEEDQSPSSRRAQRTGQSSTSRRGSAIKLEDEDLDFDATPKRAGPSRISVSRASRSQATPNARDSPSDVASPSADASDQGSRFAARKRRGEEQLLLDDHLLPAEMRRTGHLAGKRGHPSAVKEEGEDEDEEEGEPDETEPVVDEDVEMEEDTAIEADEPALDDEKVAEEAVVEADVDDLEPPEGDDEKEDVTRCVCKREDIDIMMIQCDHCNVWQHGPCVGIWADEEAPDEYFCEECRPELHGPLRKWMRSRGRNIDLTFQTPTPEDLLKFHSTHDRYPPSQSKRWSDPELIDPSMGKPLSRSHHRKDPGSPMDEGRRPSRGGRGLPGPSVKAEKPPSVSKQDLGKAPAPRIEVQHRRRVSMGGVRSPSPKESLSPQAFGHLPPKRRSTMNSRDAAYEEEQFMAALEASRLELEGPEDGDPNMSAIDDEDASIDRSVSRKGKRKRDDTGTAEAVEDDDPNGLHRPKHPNQYTYRPKPPSQQNGINTTQRSTPIPVLPPAQHEHGTRRAGAIANGIIPPPPNTISVHNLHWHLPEHLSAFSDLLKTPKPIALESRASRQMTYLTRNYFHNQKYGPFSEDRDENGKLLLPDEPPPREPIGGPITQLEPPARVRFPARRITTAEMKKRVRNVLEYVGRVQVEETKRKDRAAQIPLPDVSTLPPVQRLDKNGNVLEGDEDPETQHEAVMVNSEPSAASMMTDLIQDLIAFQETFAAGGFATPMLDANGADSEPPTPALPTTATLESSAIDENQRPVPENDDLEAGKEPEWDGEDITMGDDVDEAVIAAVDEPPQVKKDSVIKELATEPIEVYREGEVDVVVSEPIEEEAAKQVQEAIMA